MTKENIQLNGIKNDVKDGGSNSPNSESYIKQAHPCMCSWHYVKSEAKKTGHVKNWPLIKNPQFLSYPHET